MAAKSKMNITVSLINNPEPQPELFNGAFMVQFPKTEIIEDMQNQKLFGSAHEETRAAAMLTVQKEIERGIWRYLNDTYGEIHVYSSKLQKTPEGYQISNRIGATSNSQAREGLKEDLLFRPETIAAGLETSIKSYVTTRITESTSRGGSVL